MDSATASLLDDYAALKAEAAAHSAQGWSPSPVEGWKDEFQVTADSLAEFRCHSISGGTINFPDRPATRSAMPQPEFFAPRTPAQIARGHLTVWRRCMQLISALPKGHLGLYRRLAQDDGAHGAQRWMVPGIGLVTEASIRYAYYAAALSEKLGKGQPIFEIGAGFGGLAQRLVPLLDPHRYIITDLPLNMLLAYTNLSGRFPGEVGRIWLSTDRLGPARIQIVAPWRLTGLGLTADTAINTVSFQHMSMRNLEFYGDAMAALGVRQLYHVNRDVKRDPTDVPCSSYPFRDRFEVALSREFPFVGRNVREELMVARQPT